MRLHWSVKKKFANRILYDLRTMQDEDCAPGKWMQDFFFLIIAQGHYGAMIHDFLFENMKDINSDETATIDLWKPKLGDKLISKNVNVNWPSRTWNLIPLDYWGFVKPLVYANKNGSKLDAQNLILRELQRCSVCSSDIKILWKKLNFMCLLCHKFFQ